MSRKRNPESSVINVIDKADMIEDDEYFDGTGLAGLDQQYIQDPTNPIFSGDTIALYYMGMMLTLGYYNVGDVHATN